jgi:NAD(P)H-quinone oxidoreductase subunit 3
LTTAPVATALNEWVYVLIFLTVAAGFAVAPVVLSYLLAPRQPAPLRDEIYESGMAPLSPAWIQFGASYYLFALIFLAFDVDVLYLFPVAVAYNQGFAWRDLLEVFIFLAVLGLAIAYVWRKGVFKWK